MQHRMKSLCLTGLFVLINFNFVSYAQEKDPASRFSHKGLKASIGSASFDMIAERNLQEGEGGVISLGYGFSNSFSLWLTLLGSDHQPDLSNSPSSARKAVFDKTTAFGGLELNVQHKFDTDSRLQPYGKVGVGVYGLEEADSDITLIGAGINLGLGVDYFFSGNFGVGAELSWKKLDYFRQSQETAAGDLLTEISPTLNGDTVAFMLTFTVQ